jgi:hypothetical protein
MSLPKIGLQERFRQIILRFVKKLPMSSNRWVNCLTSVIEHD